MKVIYMAHPLGGNVEDNLRRAKLWYAYILRNFPEVAVVADWIVTAQVFDDAEPNDRARGMAANAALIPLCAEVWLVGRRMSTGMLVEANIAFENNVPVLRLGADTADGLPPAAREEPTPFQRAA